MRRPAGRTVRRPTSPEARSRIRLVVTSGPDKGTFVDLGLGVHVVGADPDCALVLADEHVSRRHLEVTVLPDRVDVCDLGSTNGSFCGGARFEKLRLEIGTSILVGDTELRLTFPDQAAAVGDGGADAVEVFGKLVGRSRAMHELFRGIRNAARGDATVLLQGETGTGKELLAEAIHLASPRAGGPFVICDLASLPPTLIESELFGHARGAFTGADRERQGAFAQAEGGTIFLDEIGELEVELQPRLLRVLENRQVKPVGGPSYAPIDVRVVAATNRNLVEEIQAGRFRRDLYHRLMVVSFSVPPLRERPDDIPPLVEHFLAQLAAAGGARLSVAPTTLAALCAHDWPGNVRELRHVLERAVALEPDATTLSPSLLGLVSSSDPQPAAADTAMPFREAKQRLLESWERDYVQSVLKAANGNVSEAARRAGMSRVNLYNLMTKYRLSSPG